MKLEFTPDEYVSELHMQVVVAIALVEDLGADQLNWQPEGGRSWSVGQCLDHLLRTNEAVLAEMRATVEANRDELRPREGKIQAAGWPSRQFIKTIGPESKSKLRAPKKIVPESQVPENVALRFVETQNAVEQFVNEFRDADLGALRYRNPLIAVLSWTIDSGLLILVRHNARHLQQAERVKERAEFPE